MSLFVVVLHQITSNDPIQRFKKSYPANAGIHVLPSVLSPLGWREATTRNASEFGSEEEG